jgi:hypothetical protein
MNTSELSRRLHASADSVPPRSINTDAVIRRAQRVRRRRRATTAVATIVIAAAGIATGLLATGEPGPQVATIAPQPLPRPSAKSPTVSTTPTPTPTSSRLTLPSGWIEAPTPPNAADLARARVGGEVVYWGTDVNQDIASGYGNIGAVFHVRERHWSTTSKSPLAGRAGAAVAGSDTLFFVWGGSPSTHGTPLTDGATYDLAANSWQVLPPAPTLSGRPVGAAWTGTEFVVVGPGDCAAYNPGTNTWRTLPRIPGPPTEGTVLQVGDRTYVVGAYSAYLTQGTNAWTPIPSLQNATVATMSAATDGHALFAAALTGARNAPAPAPLIVDSFDPATATWVALPTSPAREAECLVPFAVTAKNVFVACASSALYDRQAGTWHDYGPARSWGGGPGSVGGGDAVAVDDEIVFAGSPTLIYSNP